MLIYQEGKTQVFSIIIIGIIIVHIHICSEAK